MEPLRVTGQHEVNEHRAGNGMRRMPQAHSDIHALAARLLEGWGSFCHWLQ